MTAVAWTITGVVGAAVVLAITRYATRAIAALVVSDIGDALEFRWQIAIDEAVEPINEQIEEIRAEVTVNGGGSLKDRVLEMQRQLEQLITG